MKKSRRRILLIALCVIGVGTLAIPQYLYLSGLKGVPENRQPLHDPLLSAGSKRTYWRFLGGEHPAEISPRSPHGFIIDFFWPASDLETHRFWRADYRLLSEAARLVMFREEFSGDWHLSNAAASIWISRNWTADEALSTVLLESYYGHGFHGVADAAKGYFGAELPDLTDAQLLSLLVIRAAPTKYEPWCNPEFHRERYEVFAERMGLSSEYDDISIVSPSEGTCNQAIGGRRSS